MATKTDCERAKVLLARHLSPEQKRTFERAHYFEVRGQLTRMVYRLYTDDDGLPRVRAGFYNFWGRYLQISSYCVWAHGQEMRHSARNFDQPFYSWVITKAYALPAYDQLLAFKLAIEADEGYFLKRANDLPYTAYRKKYDKILKRTFPPNGVPP